MLLVIKRLSVLGPIMLIGLTNLTACACFGSADTRENSLVGQTAGEIAPAANTEAKNAHSVSGAQPKTPSSQNNVKMDVHPLSWVTDADPLHDAKQAIHKGDLRLLAFAGRAISIPGVDLAVYPLARIQQQCGYRTLKGTGDTLRVGEQTSLRSKAHDYAVIYNRKVIAACVLP
jgi:hypothetical protein